MAFNRTVVIVDDKPVIGKQITMCLKGLDYTCVYHSNPIKCIKWLNDNELPALIITDLRMPSMSGNKFVHYLKEDERYKDIPIMIVSSEEDPEGKIDLYKEGALYYIMKPFNPADVRARVQNIVG